MKVVVTGLSGNIGTAFLRRHGRDPALRITGVARRAPGRLPGVEWVSCELEAETALATLTEAFEGADAIVHLAWAIHPEATEPPLRLTNREGTRNVLDAMVAAKVPQLVCASSVAAYSPAPRKQKVRESWPCGGIAASAYSRGKAELEQRLDEFEAAHPEVAVARIRPCAVVQRHAAGQYSRWLLSPLLPVRLVGSRWLPLPFWPRMRAQAVHAEDVADAILAILLQRASGAFNLAGDGVLGPRELAATIGGPWLPLPLAPVRAAALLAWRAGLQPVHPGWLTLADRVALIDTSRAREVLGWHPRHDSSEAIRELAAGIAEGAGSPSPPLVPDHRRPGFTALTPGRPSRQSQA